MHPKVRVVLMCLMCEKLFGLPAKVKVVHPLSGRREGERERKANDDFDIVFPIYVVPLFRIVTFLHHTLCIALFPPNCSTSIHDTVLVAISLFSCIFYESGGDLTYNRKPVIG